METFICRLGSYNEFNHKLYRDAAIISLVDTFTSLLAGFTIFAVLGHLSLELGVDFDKVSTAEMGLAFETYPLVIAKFGWAPQVSLLSNLVKNKFGWIFYWIFVYTILSVVFSLIFSHVVYSGCRKFYFGCCSHHGNHSRQVSKLEERADRCWDLHLRVPSWSCLCYACKLLMVKFLVSS